MKFKIGDKVVRARGGSNRRSVGEVIHQGMVGIVSKFDEDGWIYLEEFPFRNNPDYFDLLERKKPIEFKIGRLVRIKQLVNHGYGHHVGDVGLVIDFEQFSTARPIVVVANRESSSDYAPGVMYTNPEEQLEVL